MQDRNVAWSRTNQLIIHAAERLGVEAAALASEHTDYFMRLRWAAAPGGPRAVIVSKTRSPFLTEVAQALANNKFVARELLGARGLPVVPSRLFDESCDPARDATAAVRARALLAEWGRVVVKPNWGNRGLGIVTEVDDFEQLCAAHGFARELDRDEEVLIEPWIAGTNLRVAVIGSRVEAVAEIRRPQLCGDGRRPISELLDALNDDSRRGSWRQPSLAPLDCIEPELVAERLAVNGLSLDDVLASGQRVELCFDELEVIDRTDELDPRWAEVAVEAARVLGVDVAGVDLRGPLERFTTAGPGVRGDAGLLEVNALPALHLHALPTRGRPRPVFEAFVAYCLQLPGAPRPCAEVLA